jgi:hypothetical protein
MKSITSKISIIILSIMASTFTFAEDKPAEGIDKLILLLGKNFH